MAQIAEMRRGRLNRNAVGQTDLESLVAPIVSSCLRSLRSAPLVCRDAIRQLGALDLNKNCPEVSQTIDRLIDDRLNGRLGFRHFDPRNLAPLILSRHAWRQAAIMSIINGANQSDATGRAQCSWSLAINKFDLLEHFLATRLDASISFLIEIAEEIDDAIQNNLIGSPNLRFRFDLGDFHNNNRSTLEVIDQDNAVSWYYKPRPPQLEAGMGALLDLAPAYAKLSIPKVFSGKHGHWAAGIDHPTKNVPSDDLEGIAQLIHFCMTFNLTDMHADNYISNAGSICIVDGETFFASRPRFVSDRDRRSYADVYDVFSTSAVANEFDQRCEPVDGTGLQRLLAGRRFSESDISKIVNLIKSLNREPSVSLSFDFAKSFLSSCRLRYLHRDTKAYFWMLDLLAHPHALRSETALAESAELVFSNLTTSDEELSKTVAQSELRQLLCADIPYFFRKFGSTHLHDPDSKLAPDYFDQSQIEKIEIKFSDRFKSEDANLAKLKLSLEIEAECPREPFEMLQGDPVHAAAQILGNAVHYGEDGLPYWHGVSPSFDGETFALSRTQPLDFYGGSLGIAGALNILGGEQTNSKQVTPHHVIDQHASREINDSLSVAALIDLLRFYWITEGEVYAHQMKIRRLVDVLAAKVSTHEQEFDFLSGWAGFFSLAPSWPTAEAILCEKLGGQQFHDQFMARISDFLQFLSEYPIATPQTIDRQTEDRNRRCGLAHGVAGHLQALHSLTTSRCFPLASQSLQQSIDDARVRTLALLARRAEAMPLDDDDVRWCNGRLGELLALIQASGDDIPIVKAAEWALEKSTLQFDRSHFCCGEAGFLFFQYILSTNPTLSPRLRDRVKKQMTERAKTLTDMLTQQELGFGVGFDKYSANPGLFTGISGVALVLNLIREKWRPDLARGPWLFSVPTPND